jgi:hypothetical protein
VQDFLGLAVEGQLEVTIAVRSHVDLCLFVRYMHANERDLEPEFASRLIQIDMSDKDAVWSAWTDYIIANPNVSFHETYHYWQGLRLPFLYRYAVLSSRITYLAFAELSRQYDDLHEWDCILPELGRLQIPNRLWITDTGLVWGGPVSECSNLGNPSELSPLDLLEGATSLAEYQVLAATAVDRTDVRKFLRWSKRNPAYLDAFHFVARFLDNESSALRLFIPLVNAAFHTTEPVRAFAELLGFVRSFLSSDEGGRFLAQREPVRWRKVFASGLDQISFEAAPNTDANLLGSAYHRLTLEQWVEARYGTIADADYAHPFLTEPARAWLRLEIRNPIFSWILDAPGWAGSDSFWQCFVDFMPSLTFVRFHGEGTRNRQFIVADHKKLFPLWQEWLVIHSTVRRASGAHFEAKARLCHHQDCPEYVDNYCNSFPKVPTRWQDCTFIEKLVQIRKTVKAK